MGDILGVLIPHLSSQKVLLGLSQEDPTTWIFSYYFLPFLVSNNTARWGTSILPQLPLLGVCLLTDSQLHLTPKAQRSSSCRWDPHRDWKRHLSLSPLISVVRFVPDALAKPIFLTHSGQREIVEVWAAWDWDWLQELEKWAALRCPVLMKSFGSQKNKHPPEKQSPFTAARSQEILGEDRKDAGVLPLDSKSLLLWHRGPWEISCPAGRGK